MAMASENPQKPVTERPWNIILSWDLSIAMFDDQRVWIKNG